MEFRRVLFRSAGFLRGARHTGTEAGAHTACASGLLCGCAGHLCLHAGCGPHASSTGLAVRMDGMSAAQPFANAEPRDHTLDACFLGPYGENDTLLEKLLEIGRAHV